jgi:hypothetical protein
MSREPKLPIERDELNVRLEKRILAVMHDIAEMKQMTLTEMLEETLLHTFEPWEGGVASPHTQWDIERIQELKAKHGIDYDSHASYRFTESEPEASEE